MWPRVFAFFGVSAVSFLAGFLASTWKAAPVQRAIGSNVVVSAPMELQEGCAARAAEFFKRQGYVEGPTSVGWNNYRSHYDPVRGKCFVAIESAAFKDGFTRIRQLWDAVEGRSYADFIWFSDGTKKYWEVSPAACRLSPIGEKEAFCSSESEFDEYVSSYLDAR